LFLTAKIIASVFFAGILVDDIAPYKLGKPRTLHDDLYGIHAIDFPILRHLPDGGGFSVTGG
jgi:hypothetical protein